VALQYLRDFNSLRDDPDFLIEATRIDLQYIQLASRRLANDKAFAINVLNIIPNAFCFMSDSIRANKECTLAALSMHPENLAFAAEELRSDKDVILTAIQAETFFNSGTHSSPSFNMASSELRNDPEILQAVKIKIERKIKAEEIHVRTQ
jgi:hypothetical protein